MAKFIVPSLSDLLTEGIRRGFILLCLPPGRITSSSRRLGYHRRSIAETLRPSPSGSERRRRNAPSLVHRFGDGPSRIRRSRAVQHNLLSTS